MERVLNIILLPDVFFTQVMRMVDETLDLLRSRNVSMKIGVDLTVAFVRRDRLGVVFDRTIAQFSLPAIELNQFCFDSTSSSLIRLCMEYESRGSNWQVESVNAMEFNVSQYNTIRQVAGRGSEYAIVLPKKLAVKKAVVNVHNRGDDCFKYALLSVLHYKDIAFHRERPAKYVNWMNEHSWEGITMPVTAAQIPKFEKQNPGIVINLLEWRGEKDVLHPVHRIRVAPIPKSTDVATRCVSILAVELSADQWHYVGVTNFNRLLNTRTNGGDNNRQYCERCFQPLFRTRMNPDPLAAHLKVCYADRPDSVKMPVDDHLLFKNYGKTQQLPYVLYGDIECYLEPDEHNPQITHHRPCAIGLLLVNNPSSKRRPIPNEYKVFTGKDCLIHACRYIHCISDRVYQWNKKYSHSELTMTNTDLSSFNCASNCFMCDTLFSAEDVIKVREHDHITGKYRGAACQECNTKMRLKRNLLPIFFHNLKNYDSHLLFESAFGVMKDWEISVVPLTKEKYISFSAKYVVDEFEDKVTGKVRQIKMNLEFKDSVAFLSASLASLVNNLDISDLKLCSTLGVSANLIHGKGIFPYEWFDSLAKLNVTSLPPREDFYDKLNLKECSQADYQTAVSAWQLFHCSFFRDYMLAYLKLDVYQ